MTTADEDATLIVVENSNTTATADVIPFERMNELLQRLEEVRKLRKFPSWRKMAQACGVEPGHMSTFTSRASKNPDCGLSVDTLQKIAAGCGVRFEWLAEGKGTPTGRNQVPSNAPAAVFKFIMPSQARLIPKPNLEALVAANPNRWPMVSVDAARVANTPVDLTTEDWERVLDELALVHLTSRPGGTKVSRSRLKKP